LSDNTYKYELYDKDGKPLNSSYVYKYNSGLEKVYIPDNKYTITNTLYLPNLINV